MSIFSQSQIEINSPNVVYTTESIESTYEYSRNVVTMDESKLSVKPEKTTINFKTQRAPQKTGVMFVGWGGNNGTTVTSGIIANKKKITWNTKRGELQANFIGSVTQSSTIKVGVFEDKEVYVPFNHIVPMINPCDLVIGGWDINNMNLGDAMKRAAVYDYEFQQKLYPYMKEFVPLPSLYYPDYIAANQNDRANNVVPGNSKKEHIEHIRKDIRDFKAKNHLDTVIILWTANTERFSELKVGLNDTWENLNKSIERNESEVAPSTIFAISAILEGCTYINGSPQNTFVPGVLELAETKSVYIAGNDFKSGQTKIKSVLVDYLVSAGIKPTSVVSYNHLGNNDGKNLSAPQQFRSKEISKSNVIDDMVNSNGILYKNNEKPDHCVVIKYVPYVGDSKRALDEYTSEIFCGGMNTISMHNTCEDSLLAAPLMIDFIVLSEMIERITLKYNGSKGYERFHSVLSLLSYLAKAPEVPPGTPVINSLFKQRECLMNLFRACVGLEPENHMLLESKVKPLHF